MQKYSNKIFWSLSIIIIGIIFGLGVGLVKAWVEPKESPPNGNLPAPINVGSLGQTKTGGLILNTGGAAYGLIVDNGSVGIGVRDPSQKLDVNGYVKGRTGLCIGDDCRTAWPSGGGGGGVAGSGSANYISKWTGSTSIGNSIIYDNGTNVGIGTTNPSQKLDVNGYVKGTGLCIGNDCRTAWPSGGGGGITSINGMTGPAISITAGSNISISNSGNTVQISATGGSGSLPTGSNGQTLRYNGFSPNTGWEANSNLFNDGTNIGIGTTYPTEKLTVNGRAKIGKLYLSDNSTGYTAPGFGTDGTNVGALTWGDFYVVNGSVNAYQNVRAKDYWIDAIGKWASQLGGGGGYQYVEKVFSGVHCDANFYGHLSDGTKQWLGGYWGEWGCNAPTTACSTNPSGPVSSGCTIRM